MPTWLFSKTTWMIALGMAAVIAVYVYGQQQHKAGRKAERLIQFEATAQAISNREQLLQARYQKLLNQKEQERQAALSTVAKLRNQAPKVRYVEIEKVVNANPDCHHLDAGFAQLLNTIYQP